MYWSLRKLVENIYFLHMFLENSYINKEARKLVGRGYNLVFFALLKYISDWNVLSILNWIYIFKAALHNSRVFPGKKKHVFYPFDLDGAWAGACQDIKRKNRLRSMLSRFLDIAKRIELRSELYYCAFLSAHTQTKGSNDYSNMAQLVHFTCVQNSLNSRWSKTDCLSLFWGLLASSFCSQNLGKPRITKCRLSLFIFFSSGSLY